MLNKTTKVTNKKKQPSNIDRYVWVDGDVIFSKKTKEVETKINDKI